MLLLFFWCCKGNHDGSAERVGQEVAMAMAMAAMTKKDMERKKDESHGSFGRQSLCNKDVANLKIPSN